MILCCEGPSFLSHIMLSNGFVVVGLSSNNIIILSHGSVLWEINSHCFTACCFVVVVMRLSYIMLCHGGIQGFELLCDWVWIQQPFLFSPAAALVAMVRVVPARAGFPNPKRLCVFPYVSFTCYMLPCPRLCFFMFEDRPELYIPYSQGIGWATPSPWLDQQPGLEVHSSHVM
jgi:hypothetical protein